MAGHASLKHNEPLAKINVILADNLTCYRHQKDRILGTSVFSTVPGAIPYSLLI